MATTIQVSETLLGSLRERKFRLTETYEEVIWDLLEDTMELSEETKKHIQQSQKEIAAGRTVSLSAIKKKLGLADVRH